MSDCQNQKLTLQTAIDDYEPEQWISLIQQLRSELISKNYKDVKKTRQKVAGDILWHIWHCDFKGLDIPFTGKQKEALEQFWKEIDKLTEKYFTREEWEALKTKKEAEREGRNVSRCCTPRPCNSKKVGEGGKSEKGRRGFIPPLKQKVGLSASGEAPRTEVAAANSLKPWRCKKGGNHSWLEKNRMRFGDLVDCLKCGMTQGEVKILKEMEVGKRG